MAFKTQSEDQDSMSEINVTPLVDVMLVLVVILLVTAPLITQSVHVELPETQATTPDVKDPPMRLSINEQGTIELNDNPVADLPQLETILKDELAKNPETAIHLYADKALNYGRVAEIMASVQHAGITKLGFVTIEK